LSLNGEASLLSSSVSCCAATAEASSPRDNLAARICMQILAQSALYIFNVKTLCVAILPEAGGEEQAKYVVNAATVICSPLATRHMMPLDSNLKITCIFKN
jgi:hypothetical protein